MNYIEYKISFKTQLSEDEAGIVMSDLGDLGFESFVEESNAILGYIPSELFVKYGEHIALYLSDNISIIESHNRTEIEQQNWNALWESNFSPTIVNERCAVRAPFHDIVGADYELVIMPKMSFGTGHHQTTRLMMQDIFRLNLDGKNGLDMGCGTGVLGILAAMRGAKHLDIIDIDQWAYENAIENVAQNDVCDQITVKVGDVALIKGMKYDFILANINRNILLSDMAKYVDTLKIGGTISISGFLADDIDILRDFSEKLGLSHELTDSDDKWQMMRFIKQC